MSEKAWILSLQDGSDPTWVKLDEKPVVFEVDEADLADPNWTPPADCISVAGHYHVWELLPDAIVRKL